MKQYSEIVITAFATYRKTVDLMNATGLSRTTIGKYKKDGELMALADARRVEIVRESVDRMRNEMLKSVEALAEIRDDKEVNPQTRAYSANSLLTHAKDWITTVEILARVEALEQAQLNRDDY